MTDGLNSKSFTLRVEGLVDTSSLALENSVQTAISGVNDIPPLITQVINVSAGEIV